MKYVFHLCLLCLLGCTHRSTNELHFTQDYEKLKGWSLANCTKEMAHSGVYAQKITDDNDYGKGFMIRLGDVSTHPLHKIKTSAWLHSPAADGQVFLVIDIFSGSENKSIAYTSGNDWSGLIKQNKTWTQCSNEMQIPANVRPDDVLKIYVWNPKKQVYYIDDFDVSFE